MAYIHGDDIEDMAKAATLEAFTKQFSAELEKAHSPLNAVLVKTLGPVIKEMAEARAEELRDQVSDLERRLDAVIAKTSQPYTPVRGQRRNELADYYNEQANGVSDRTLRDGFRRLAEQQRGRND